MDVENEENLNYYLAVYRDPEEKVNDKIVCLVNNTDNEMNNITVKFLIKGEVRFSVKSLSPHSYIIIDKISFWQDWHQKYIIDFAESGEIKKKMGFWYNLNVGNNLIKQLNKTGSIIKGNFIDKSGQAI